MYRPFDDAALFQVQFNRHGGRVVLLQIKLFVVFAATGGRIGQAAIIGAGAFAQRRCLDAKSQGDIKVSEETIKRLTTYDAEEEEEGEDAEAPKPDKPPYSVCDRVGGGGGLLTARIR